MTHIDFLANFLIKTFDFISSIIGMIVIFVTEDTLTLCIVVLATVIFLIFAVCKK